CWAQRPRTPRSASASMSAASEPASIWGSAIITTAIATAIAIVITATVSVGATATTSAIAAAGTGSWNDRVQAEFPACTRLLPENLAEASRIRRFIHTHAQSSEKYDGQGSDRRIGQAGQRHREGGRRQGHWRRQTSIRRQGRQDQGQGPERRRRHQGHAQRQVGAGPRVRLTSRGARFLSSIIPRDN